MTASGLTVGFDCPKQTKYVHSFSRWLLFVLMDTVWLCPDTTLHCDWSNVIYVPKYSRGLWTLTASELTVAFDWPEQTKYILRVFVFVCSFLWMLFGFAWMNFCTSIIIDGVPFVSPNKQKFMGRECFFLDSAL